MILRGEISAIVEIACRRDFVGMAYQASADSAAERNDRCWPIVDPTILTGSAYFNCLGSIGVLTPALAGALAGFFADLGQVTRDSMQLQSGVLSGNPAFNLQLQDGARLWSRIETHGASTMDDLQSFASQSFRAWLFNVERRL